MAKIYEILEFDLRSIARIVFLISFVVGLVVSIGVGAYAVYSGQLTFMEGIAAMIFEGLLIGAISAASYVLMGLLYNYFAKQVGGIRVKMK